jgi:hypothetical protein
MHCELKEREKFSIRQALHISLPARSAKQDFRSALWACKFLALKRNDLATLLESVVVNSQMVVFSEYVFNVAGPANNRFFCLKSPIRLAILQLIQSLHISFLSYVVVKKNRICVLPPLLLVIYRGVAGPMKR